MDIWWGVILFVFHGWKCVNETRPVHTKASDTDKGKVEMARQLLQIVEVLEDKAAKGWFTSQIDGYCQSMGLLGEISDLEKADPSSPLLQERVEAILNPCQEAQQTCGTDSKFKDVGRHIRHAWCFLGTLA